MASKKVERFRKEEKRLAKALSKHTEAIIDLAADDSWPEILRLGKKLRKAVLRYAEAQLDVVGTVVPFSPLFAEDEYEDPGYVPHDGRLAVVMRLDVAPDAVEAEVREGLAETLVHGARRATLDWCEMQPGVHPVALLTAAVCVDEGSDLANSEPILDSEELVRVLGAVESVHYSEVDVYL
ncbi:MAG: hypothetical protein QM804_06865 [Propionicimonas sp.]